MIGWSSSQPPMRDTDPRDVMAAGDSHVASLLGTVDALAPLTLSYASANFLLWWQMVTQWRFNLIGVTAAGGKRTDQVITEQLPAILAAKPGIVIESSGTNDALQGIAYDTIIANKRIIYDTLLAAGIQLRIYIAGVPTATGGGTATISRKLLSLREWNYRYAQDHPGVVIYDHHQLVVDFASSLGAFLPNCSADGVHTTILAAYRGGKAFGEMENQIHGADNTLAPKLDSVGGVSAGPATDDLRQLYGVPGLTGTAVTENNAGMSGQRPAGGWYAQRAGSATGVASVSASSRGAWNKYQLVATATANGESTTQAYGLGAADFTRLSAPATRARRVQLSMWRRLESMVNMSQMNINFNINAGVSKTVIAGIGGATSAAHFPNGETIDLEFRTPPLIIPAGAVVTGGSISVNEAFVGAGGATNTIEGIRIIDMDPSY